MFKMIIPFLLFLSQDIFASSSVCKKVYSQVETPSIIHSRTCTIEWEEKGKVSAAEMIFLKRGCKKYEGSEAQDCFLVRTCPADSNANKFTSAPIFDDQAELDQYCSFTKPELRILIGASDESPRSPVVATIDCKDGVAVSITLKSPDKKTKVCHFR